MRVLVTGATGFLGSHVLRHLQSLPGVEVVAACRSISKLPEGFTGEVRVGDLRNADYRRDVVQGMNAVCHCGTWSAMWGHVEQEQRWFREPCEDLIEQCIEAGVDRFLLASTVAIAQRSKGGPVMDDAPTAKTGFWPHLDHLVELDQHMRDNAGRGTAMVTLRLGHFVGKGNTLGLVPAIVPRLRTRMVPWLSGGTKRMALVSGEDLGQGCALACVADLDGYNSFNICGAAFPTVRQVFGHIAQVSNSPAPWFSVPQSAGYAFAWLMETLHPVMGGNAPFLTRAIVHISEDWHCPTDHAGEVLGYRPQKAWRESIDEAVAELAEAGFAFPKLSQALT